VGEPVTDKEKGNFCEWFVAISDIGKNDRAAPNSASARTKFDDLFKS